VKPAVAKASGRETENRWAKFLTWAWSASTGWAIERKRQGGARDRGDLTGMPGWTLESKKSLTALHAALDQAGKEAANNGTYWYAALLRRRGISEEGLWAVVMTGFQWARLVAEWYERGVLIVSLRNRVRELEEQLDRRRA
jgi:hypothetical protein